jgi:predicted AlkP superfamily pyrophosphatase or phosphodiesterase
MSTMLPAIPATFGRLSDVFVSSLGAITGTDNRLGFAPAKRVIAILVDGLGAQNLKAAGGHAQHLNKALAVRKPISCGFPSTTATSITSFGTGLAAGAHGLLGYKVYDRSTAAGVNMLTGWGSAADPLEWQVNATVMERSASESVGTFIISAPAYDGSGFTQATMRGAGQYLQGRTIGDRVDQAISLLRSNNDDWIAYLYIPELDQIAHAEGVASDRWLAAVEELDSEVKRLTAALGKGDAVVLTADHGVVDVPSHKQIFVDEILPKSDLLSDVCGEPRVNFVYLNDASQSARVASELQESLGDLALALTREEVEQSGWYGPLGERAQQAMPDVFLLATKQVALYHRDYVPAKSLAMIGQHGGLSAAELSIPLLGFGAFA